MIKTRVFQKENDRYLFPSQCEQVFYSNVPGKRDSSFVVRYDPRGRPVKYNVEEEYDAESEREDGPTDEEDGEDDIGIGDNAVFDDDVNENMSENDIDDGDDIVNPFNTIYELDDDTDVDLDEEEDIEYK